jgi:Uma2 family endonuclease
VVEVVSPSSRGIDTGAKLAAYVSLPSLRHYLIVDTDKHVVIHHHRDGKGEIGVRILADCALSLDPPGVTIDVRDLFHAI